MPNLNYITGIPNGPNNPSNDQPNMQTNTNSISTFLAVDHFGFKNNNGGWHKQSTYPQVLSAATTTAGQGALYVKAGAQGSQLFWIRDNTAGTEAPLTIASSGIITPFSRTQRGYTFLPGNLLFQWGFDSVNAQPATTTINFPVAFANVGGFAPIVTVTANRNSTNVDTVYVVSTVAASFVCQNTSSGGIANIYWHAIGPI
jgi:hypothetical protein